MYSQFVHRAPTFSVTQFSNFGTIIFSSVKRNIVGAVGAVDDNNKTIERDELMTAMLSSV